MRARGSRRNASPIVVPTLDEAGERAESVVGRRDQVAVHASDDVRDRRAVPTGFLLNLQRATYAVRLAHPRAIALEVVGFPSRVHPKVYVHHAALDRDQRRRDEAVGSLETASDLHSFRSDSTLASSIQVGHTAVV